MSKDPKIAKGAKQQVADAAAEDEARESSPVRGGRASSPLAAAAADTSNGRPKRGRPAVFEDDDDEEEDAPAAKKPRPKPKARVNPKSAEHIEDEDEHEQIEVPQNNAPMDVETTRPPQEEEEAVVEEEEEPVVEDEEVEEDAGESRLPFSRRVSSSETPRLTCSFCCFVLPPESVASPSKKRSALKPESTSSNSSAESVVNTGRKKRPRRG